MIFEMSDFSRKISNIRTSSLEIYEKDKIMHSVKYSSAFIITDYGKPWLSWPVKLGFFVQFTYICISVGKPRIFDLYG